ncbi:hypothetical protein C1X64_30790, partial [Pseudomonas sp. GW456-E7]
MLLKKCLLALAIGAVLSASTVLVPDYVGSFSSVHAKDGGSGGGGSGGGGGGNGGGGGHGG